MNTEKEKHENAAGDAPSESRGFKIGFKSWVLFALSAMLLVGLAYVVLGEGRRIAEYARLYVGWIITLAIIPWVLSYLVWIGSGGKKFASALTFNLAVLVTLVWLGAREMTSLSGLKPLLDFSTTQQELQKKYQAAEQSDASTDELDQEIFSNVTNYLSRMAEVSSPEGSKLYTQLGGFLTERQSLLASFESIESVVYSDDFMDYNSMRSDQGGNLKLAALDQYLTNLNQIQEQNKRFSDFVVALEPQLKSLGRMELRLIDQALVTPFLESANDMKPYYAACHEFGEDLKTVVLWVVSNKDKWDFSVGPNGEPGTMTLSSREDSDAFSKMIAKASQSLASLNAASAQLHSENAQ